MKSSLHHLRLSAASSSKFCIQLPHQFPQGEHTAADHITVCALLAAAKYRAQGVSPIQYLIHQQTGSFSLQLFFKQTDKLLVICNLFYLIFQQFQLLLMELLFQLCTFFL